MSKLFSQVVKVIYEKLVDLTGNPAVPLVLVGIFSFYPIIMEVEYNIKPHQVGNKSDLHAERAVSEMTGKKLAADMKVPTVLIVPLCVLWKTNV